MFEEETVPVLEIKVISSGLIEEEALWSERKQEMQDLSTALCQETCHRRYGHGFFN
jgi:hypothetical protein